MCGVRLRSAVADFGVIAFFDLAVVSYHEVGSVCGHCGVRCCDIYARVENRKILFAGLGVPFFVGEGSLAIGKVE